MCVCVCVWGGGGGGGGGGEGQGIQFICTYTVTGIVVLCRIVHR